MRTIIIINFRIRNSAIWNSSYSNHSGADVSSQSNYLIVKFKLKLKLLHLLSQYRTNMINQVISASEAQ